MLFKFGKAEYIRALYERGEAFIQPASTFNGMSGDTARQDDELTVQWHRAGGKIEFRASNYYCWCCGSVYDYRLFWDFRDGQTGKPGDACLAIHNPDAFVQRFAAAIKGTPDIVRLRLTPVLYYDPLAVSDNPIAFAAYQDEAIQCMKHFRFAYQWEFRVVIIPADPSSLEPFKLNLGPLKDIAELIAAPEQSA
jgi:hypothetical protein